MNPFEMILHTIIDYKNPFLVGMASLMNTARFYKNQLASLLIKCELKHVGSFEGNCVLSASWLDLLECMNKQVFSFKLEFFHY